jgi:hypothetical protein
MKHSSGEMDGWADQNRKLAVIETVGWKESQLLRIRKLQISTTIMESSMEIPQKLDRTAI